VRTPARHAPPPHAGPDGRPLSILVPNPAAPHDPSQWFSPELPEWDMEKFRFYVDLPGDFWESGALLRYLREKEVQVRLTCVCVMCVCGHPSIPCLRHSST
jgi:hypothetical protein